MGFELFIALRYLLSLRKESFISVISAFSVLGVAIGVASLIVTMGVMDGFTTEFRDKILGVNAHGVIGSAAGGLADYRQKMDKARQIEGLTGVTPFIYTEVMISAEGGVKGLVLRGIDPASAGGVLNLPRDMVVGKLDDLVLPPLPPASQGVAEDGRAPRIVLGKELADRLGLKIGDLVSVLSPTGTRGAAGFQPKVKMFEFVGSFKTGMFEYDSSMGYAHIPAVQELMGFKGDIVTGLEIRVENIYKANVVVERVREALGGFPLYARHWMEMNANLFAALQLEKTAMFVVLIMIILVGTFSIVTMLVMLVMDKTRDIAVLMSMGATAESVRRIFMYQGAVIGLMGTSLGYALGVGLALALKKYQFIELPKDVYPMDHVPVRLEWLDLTLIGVVAMALCFLATLYPSRRAARLKPAEALHYE